MGFNEYDEDGDGLVSMKEWHAADEKEEFYVHRGKGEGFPYLIRAGERQRLQSSTYLGGVERIEEEMRKEVTANATTLQQLRVYTHTHIHTYTHTHIHTLRLKQP